MARISQKMTAHLALYMSCWSAFVCICSDNTYSRRAILVWREIYARYIYSVQSFTLPCGSSPEFCRIPVWTLPNVQYNLRSWVTPQERIYAKLYYHRRLSFKSIRQRTRIRRTLAAVPLEKFSLKAPRKPHGKLASCWCGSSYKIDRWLCRDLGYRLA